MALCDATQRRRGCVCQSFLFIYSKKATRPQINLIFLVMMWWNIIVASILFTLPVLCTAVPSNYRFRSAFLVYKNSKLPIVFQLPLFSRLYCCSGTTVFDTVVCCLRQAACIRVHFHLLHHISIFNSRPPSVKCPETKHSLALIF